LPHEWESSLYNDADIEPIIQHSEIKPIITTCEVRYVIFLIFCIYIYIFFYLIKLSLRAWCEEYIRRIDESFGKELRT